MRRYLCEDLSHEKSLVTQRAGVGMFQAEEAARAMVLRWKWAWG